MIIMVVICAPIARCMGAYILMIGVPEAVLVAVGHQRWTRGTN